MGEAENLAVVGQAYEALDADDVPAFLALCTPEAQWVYPEPRQLPYGGTWSGLEGVEAFLNAHDAAEEIIDLDASDFIAQANLVVVLGHYQGRSKATGREWETDFVHVLTLRNEKIARFEAYFDTAAAVEARSAQAAPGLV